MVSYPATSFRSLIIFPLVLLFSAATSRAQTPTPAPTPTPTNPPWINWVQTVSGDGANFAQAVAADLNGNVYVAGFTNGMTFADLNTGANGTNQTWVVFLLKYNSAGILQWVRLVPQTEPSRSAAYGVTTDSAGNVYVTGGTGSGLTFGGLPTDGDGDVFLMKYTSSGTMQWNQIITGSDNGSEGVGLAADNEGGVYVTGFTKGPIFAGQPVNGPEAFFLLKYASDATLIWAHVESEPDGSNYGIKVAVDNKSHVYVTGGTGNSTFAGQVADGNTSLDVFLLQYNADGNLGWARVVSGSPGFSKATNVSVDGNGTIYVTGSTNAPTFAGRDTNASYEIPAMFLLKYNADGNVGWVRSLWGGSPHGMVVNGKGKIVVTGWTDISPFAGQTGNGVFMVQYQPSGNLDWAQVLTGANGFSEDMALDPQGNVEITGWCESNWFLGQNLPFGSEYQGVFVFQANTNAIPTFTPNPTPTSTPTPTPHTGVGVAISCEATVPVGGTLHVGIEAWNQTKTPAIGDIWVAVEINNSLYFFPSFSTAPASWLPNVTLPPGLDMTMPYNLFTFTNPGAGGLTFTWVAAFFPEGYDPLPPPESEAEGVGVTMNVAQGHRATGRAIQYPKRQEWPDYATKNA